MSVIIKRLEEIKTILAEKYPIYKPLGLEIEINLSWTEKINESTVKIHYMYLIIDSNSKPWVVLPSFHISKDHYLKRTPLANTKLNNFIKNLVQSNCV
jgi:hypothetical protein